MKIKYEVELLPFPVPENARIKQKVGRRQDGFNTNAGTIHLKDLDDDTLQALCDEWIKSVYAKAEKVLVLKNAHGRTEIWEDGKIIIEQG